jgi:hypothetical protein
LHTSRFVTCAICKGGGTFAFWPVQANGLLAAGAPRMWIVQLALKRPYTFLVLALFIAISGSLAAVRPTGASHSAS